MEVGEPTSLAVNYRTTLADVSDDSASVEDHFDDEELEALRSTAPDVVVANHVFHLLELTAIYLSADPPRLNEAQLVIDTVAAMLHAVGPRLGERSALLNEGLAQIQLAYVNVAATHPSTD